MKQVLLFFAVLFAAISMYAQPVLHAADLNPVAGDKTIMQNANLKGVKIPNAGTGITWNYSTSLKDSTSKPDTSTYRAATGTPYASLFKGSNLAATLSATPGLYVYYKTSTKLLDFYGEADKTDTLTWNPPYRIGIFPVTYGTNFTDTSTVSVNESGQTIVEGYRDSADVIGYGTLKLPGARIFHNVILVKVTDITKVTILGHTNVSKSYAYNFYVKGYHGPLLSVDAGSATSIDAVSYSKNATAALENGDAEEYTVSKLNVNSKSIFSVYPNPAASRFTVTANQKNKTISSVVINDMQGRNVFVKQTNNSVTETISCASFDAGIYFVRILMTDGTEEVQKLVVSK